MQSNVLSAFSSTIHRANFHINTLNMFFYDLVHQFEEQ